MQLFAEKLKSVTTEIKTNAKSIINCNDQNFFMFMDLTL